MKEFTGELLEFLKEIGFKNEQIGILKKQKGRKIIELYWEKYDKSNDKWFLNLNEIFQDSSESYFIIKPNIEKHIKYLISTNSYRMYLK